VGRWGKGHGSLWWCGDRWGQGVRRWGVLSICCFLGAGWLVFSGLVWKLYWVISLLEPVSLVFPLWCPGLCGTVRRSWYDGPVWKLAGWLVVSGFLCGSCRICTSCTWFRHLFCMIRDCIYIYKGHEFFDRLRLRWALFLGGIPWFFFMQFCRWSFW
jgi:hypothetical protein